MKSNQKYKTKNIIKKEVKIVNTVEGLPRRVIETLTNETYIKHKDELFAKLFASYAYYSVISPSNFKLLITIGLIMTNDNCFGINRSAINSVLSINKMKRNSFSNSLCRMRDFNLIIRIHKGFYMVNPYILTRVNVTETKKLRNQWEMLCNSKPQKKSIDCG